MLDRQFLTEVVSMLVQGSLSWQRERGMLTCFDHATNSADGIKQNTTPRSHRVKCVVFGIKYGNISILCVVYTLVWVWTKLTEIKPTHPWKKLGTTHLAICMRLIREQKEHTYRSRNRRIPE
jgi:hypothetical protein